MSRLAKGSTATPRVLLARGAARLDTRALSFVVSVAFLAGGAAACGDRRLRSEARAFLARYEAIDHREKGALREQKVQALEQLVLTEPQVLAARSHCLDGHNALLASERSHEHAAQQLDRAVGDSPGGAPLSPEATEQIRVEIEQADNALARAKENLRQCENEARGLSLRFGKL
jgi:hypothetical protein